MFPGNVISSSETQNLKTIRPEVSVVVYVDNHLDNAAQMYAYVANFLLETGKEFEFIFMDDGTNTQIYSEMESVQGFVRNARVIRLPRNYGPSTAMPVGFRHARGKYILTLGSFLQIKPEEIRKMFKKIEEGYDFVNGWRQNRTDSKLNQFHTRIYNWFVSKVSQVKIHDTNCTLKLFKREIIDELVIYGDLYRFLPVMAASQGFIVGEIPVDQRTELNRVGIYSIGTYIRRYLDLLALFFISRFTSRPLRFFGPVGLLLFTSGLAAGAYLIYVKYGLGQAIGGAAAPLFGGPSFNGGNTGDISGSYWGTYYFLPGGKI